MAAIAAMGHSRNCIPFHSPHLLSEISYIVTLLAAMGNG